MAVRAVRSRKAAAPIALRSGSGRVACVIQPGAGCCITSLTIEGREWLHLPEPVAAFLRHDRTGGVPILFPWANRLRGDRFRLLGREITLPNAACVHRDGQGRPMHGILLRNRNFCVAHGRDSEANAVLDWSRSRELLRCFPFPFVLRLAWRLIDAREVVASSGGGGAMVSAGIEIATEFQSMDASVPLSFGWHPYLRLPAPRGSCRLQSPALARVPLQEGLPRRRAGSLELDEPAPLDRPLASASLDDHFAGAGDGTIVRATGPRGRSVQVEFVRGYRWAQIYSPRGADFVAIEPMMAPVAAISDGGPELPILGPGQRFTAIFRIMVQAPGAAPRHGPGRPLRSASRRRPRSGVAA